MSVSNLSRPGFGTFIRLRRENANLTAMQVAAAIHMPPDTLAAIESSERIATDAQRAALRFALARLEPHPLTCCCQGYHDTVSGELAVRAYMRGDDSAAARLSRSGVAVLAAQRAAKIGKVSRRRRVS
jgi:transcriptional regulator with XRE-family HTH domain